MTDKLTQSELVALVKRVFAPGEDDKGLAIIVDMPDAEVPDNNDWRVRRDMAAEWAELLALKASELGLERITLALYRNPRANNADLPATATIHEDGPLPETADGFESSTVAFDHIFENYQILIAPTEFSATAPLKMAAKKYHFRAATMPGFSPSMIPALRVDYEVVGARVDRLKSILDRAEGCAITFDARGVEHELFLDLRHRTAHASGGLFPVGGVAGNLPSGESYIVPYEGEVAGEATKSKGTLPVQFGADIVVYEVEANRAIEVLSSNPKSKEEAEKLAAEPAYGNLAELGLGVLGDFGLEPTGEILLDEKLGLHIAFGRSEHFGGQVGPSDFSGPDKVVHIDRVYIPALQADVKIREATVVFATGEKTLLMKDGEYRIDFA